MLVSGLFMFGEYPIGSRNAASCRSFTPAGLVVGPGFSSDAQPTSNTASNGKWKMANGKWKSRLFSSICHFPFAIFDLRAAASSLVRFHHVVRRFLRDRDVVRVAL